jgi:hypothetical protein
MGGGGGDKFGKLLMYKELAGERLALCERLADGLPHFRPADERKMNGEIPGIVPQIANNARGLVGGERTTGENA